MKHLNNFIALLNTIKIFKIYIFNKEGDHTDVDDQFRQIYRDN